MRYFTVSGPGPSWERTFITRDNWEGLWAPVAILDYPAEPDGHFPDHKQIAGTCDVQGERAVRARAREMMRNHLALAD
jgi:hypothetical protein